MSTSQIDYQRMIAEMSELAGGLAHELRNPLSTMMINLKLLAEDLRDENAHPDDMRRRAMLKVDSLRYEAERLQRLFDEFLHVAGPYRLQSTSCNLNDVVAKLISFVEPEARERGIDVKTNFSPNNLNCRIDANLIRQALVNILSNAQDAMPEGGTLTISTRQEDAIAVVRVADTGVGIAEEDHEKISRPFFSTKAQGTGLGLSITRRIIHEHSGTLALHSKLGEGTTVIVRLPMGPISPMD